MYLIAIGPNTYEPRDGRPGFTLVEALREVCGTGGARVLRLDGTVVVRDAGSTVAPWTHAPTGRTIRHRPTRWARAQRAA